MKKPSKQRTAYLNDFLDKKQLGPKQQKVTQAPPPLTPLSGSGPSGFRRSAPDDRKADELAALGKGNNDSKQPEPPPEAKQPSSRGDLLTPAIGKAVAATDGSNAAVFLYLKEMALNSQVPFTGYFDSDGAILYTNASNAGAKLTRNALRKRLQRRR